MSFGKTVYGGFPGPPDGRNHDSANQDNLSRRYSHHHHGSQSEQYHQDVPVAEFYGGPHSGYIPHEVNYDGNYHQHNLYYGSPAGFTNPPTYFGPHYGMTGGSSTFPMVNMPNGFEPNYYTEDATAGYPETNSFQRTTLMDNASAAGKSRRFSRQRNVKEAGASGEVNMQFADEHSSSKNNKEKRSHSSKQPIRFSHQKVNGVENPNRQKKDSSNKKSEARAKHENKLSEEKATKRISSKESKKSEVMKVDKRDQASVLHEQLTSGTYECMVCCDHVRPPQAVWSCGTCYNVFHMGCIKKWARSPAARIEESGWRCPGCQNVTPKIPASYYCFCGKLKEPEYRKGEMPHSCGELCGKARKNNPDCKHPCNILCHPGPCPQCPATIMKRCRCGRVTSRVRCSQQKNFMCSEKCGKKKKCGRHFCEKVCHAGKCEDCDVIVKQSCYCGGSVREVNCGSNEHNKQPLDKDEGCYSCANVCGKTLLCGNHKCEDLCHPGACKPCPLLPSLLKVCPCTQTKLSDMKGEDGTEIRRKICTDPVPTCGKICNKPTSCGGEEIHLCKLPCHHGPCLPCVDGESTIKCRCGKSEKEVPCSEFVKMETYICDRRCNKKRKCGKHKCGQMCCLDTEHACMQICGRKLTCGNHRCDETCHRGACHTCYNVSFDELRCYCNDKVIFPPIPCGMKPPECNNECTRMHPCTHPIRHSCHTEENCPPCVELVKKTCNCGRTVRGNIMCHITNVSCGAPCSKMLACGHKCQRPCHKGACCEDGEPCKQPCSIMRVECIHPCANPCHYGGPCPNTLCQATVTVKCECGRREEQVECSAGGAVYQSMSSAAFATKSNDAINIDKMLQTRGLQCDEECSIAARNKRFAEALRISDAEYGSKLKQQYSDFLMNMAKTDLAFIRTVEKDLINLVESVSWLDTTKQSHPFPSMKRDKRQAVHELAEAFQCKSESLDEEPNRNVVATATKNVSKQPTPLLSDFIMEQVTTEKTYASAKSVQPKGRVLSSVKLVSLRSAKSSEATGRPGIFNRKPSTGGATASTFKPSSTRYEVPRSSLHRLTPASDGRNNGPRFPQVTSQDAVRPSVSRPEVKPSVKKYAPPHQRVTPAAGSSSTDKSNVIDYFDMTD
uniref:Transcription factor protein n=1 Tax=Ciona intestinalis TaxID=7719 RepID=Q4H346_CIOIN|nr:transcription factor protein [Ciona intestinalis]BAE06581.1 transcription factor protein [Ciona intestinalis]|eukprot:NP_001071774.1 transcription factor protein [Ciona intestinalis]